MSWFFQYWQEFYAVLGGLVLLCIIVAFIMDCREYRKRLKNRKDWWEHDSKE